MKIQNFIGELRNEEVYKSFKLENPSSFFAAGFFILDLENDKNQIQIDFFLPEQNKIASFELQFLQDESGKERRVWMLKIFKDEVKNMDLQSTDIKIDLDDLRKISEDIIKENGAVIIPTKIIAILKNNEWNLTCMNDALGIVRIKLDAVTGEKIDFSKGSLMDFMGVKKNKPHKQN